MQDFEKLSAFYLGKIFDASAGRVTDDILLYDAKDLTTHAVCVGMTGSGKTGLCVALLEEAAIDGIPAIAIDPKGDLGNLMLTFPGLQAADFLPWVDQAEAARKGQSPEEYARSTADRWREGLSEWGQDGARIARFREAVDVAIYTPGSTAGRPLTILRSFAPPPEDPMADADALRDRIMATVSGILALIGIEADPVQSREHILLSSILAAAWGARQSLDLATLIREVQKPPFAQLGVFDLETFYPAKERMALAMRLNSVLASPGFAVWSQGEPLDIKRLLYTPEGRPRLSILSIAHLSDAERMFFVTLLLNELVTWMRAQPGTSSLRAMLYMDEVFGFFPPVSNPPSKPPMLTLLKQARAFGLGCVLATQNPADLDYKGLGNAGTWFIGRLQAERDKARLLDGLEGAASGPAFQRADMDKLISGLGSRVFLMNNVHDERPVVFQSRWALSYLRGPLSRAQIQALTATGRSAAPAAPATSTPAVPANSPVGPDQEPEPASSVRTDKPATPATAREFFLAAARPAPEGAGVVYRPSILGLAKLHYVSAPAKIDLWQNVGLLAALPEDDEPVGWESAMLFDNQDPQLDKQAVPGARYADLPPAASKAANYNAWQKDLAAHLYQQRPLRLWRCAALAALSAPAETEGDFRVRIQQLAREARDVAVEKLKTRYQPKLTALQERLRKAEARVDVEKGQYRQQGLHTALSIGATVLGALLGRRAASVGTVQRASTAMRGAGRAAREKTDIGRAQDTVGALRTQLQELEAAFEAEGQKIGAAHDPASLEVAELSVSPRKSDIAIRVVGLAWTPWAVDRNGLTDRLY